MILGFKNHGLPSIRVLHAEIALLMKVVTFVRLGAKYLPYAVDLLHGNVSVRWCTGCLREPHQCLKYHASFPRVGACQTGSHGRRQSGGRIGLIRELCGRNRRGSLSLRLYTVVLVGRRCFCNPLISMRDNPLENLQANTRCRSHVSVRLVEPSSPTVTRPLEKNRYDDHSNPRSRRCSRFCVSDV